MCGRFLEVDGFGRDEFASADAAAHRVGMAVGTGI
jgi:hypothetical protein